MGAKGKPKTGGRRKGTPNKVTMDALEYLREAGHEPAAFHLQIVIEAWAVYQKKKKRKGEYGAASALDVAQKANAELMKYCYPTRKAVEHSGAGGGPIVLRTYQDVVVALGGDVGGEEGSESESGGNKKDPSATEET